MAQYSIQYSCLFNCNAVVSFSLPVYTQEYEPSHYFEVCCSFSGGFVNEQNTQVPPTCITVGDVISVTCVPLRTHAGCFCVNLQFVVNEVSYGGCVRFSVQPNIHAFSLPNSTAFLQHTNIYHGGVNDNIIDTQREVLSGVVSNSNPSQFSSSNHPRTNLRFSEFIGALILNSQTPVFFPNNSYQHYYDSPQIQRSSVTTYARLSCYFNSSSTPPSCPYGCTINSSSFDHCNFLIGLTYNPYSTFITYSQLINSLPGILYSSIQTNVPGQCLWICRNNQNQPFHIQYNSCTPTFSTPYMIIHNYSTFYTQAPNETINIDFLNLSSAASCFTSSQNAIITGTVKVGKLYRTFQYEDIRLVYSGFPVTVSNSTLNIKLPFSIWGKKISDGFNYVAKAKFVDVYARSWNNQNVSLNIVVSPITSNDYLLGHINSQAFSFTNVPITYAGSYSGRYWFAGKLVLCKVNNNVCALYSFYTNWSDNTTTSYTIQTVCSLRHLPVEEVNTSLSLRNRGVQFSSSPVNIDCLPYGTYFFSVNNWCTGNNLLNSYRTSTSIRVTTWGDGNISYQEVLGVNRTLYAHRICPGFGCCWCDFRIITNECTTEVIQGSCFVSNCFSQDAAGLQSDSCYYQTTLNPNLKIIYGNRVYPIFSSSSICCVVMPSAFLCFDGRVYPLTYNVNNMLWSPNPILRVLGDCNFGDNVRYCTNLSALGSFYNESGSGLVLGSTSGPSTAVLKNDIFVDKLIVLNNTTVETNGWRIYARCMVVGDNVKFTSLALDYACFGNSQLNLYYHVCCLYSCSPSCSSLTNYVRRSYFGGGILLHHCSCVVRNNVGGTNTVCHKYFSFCTHYGESCFIDRYRDFSVVNLSGIVLNCLCLTNGRFIMQSLSYPTACYQQFFPVGFASLNLSFLQEPKVYVPPDQWRSSGFYTSCILFFYPYSVFCGEFCFSYNFYGTGSYCIYFYSWSFQPPPIYINVETIKKVGTGHWFIAGPCNYHSFFADICISGSSGPCSYGLCVCSTYANYPQPIFLITSNVNCMPCFCDNIARGHPSYINYVSGYYNVCCFSCLPTCLIFFVKL